MSTLVIVEHNHHIMAPSTRHVLTAALELDPKLTCLVVGYHCEAVAVEVASLKGVSAVFLADHLCYEHQFPEAIALLVQALSPSFTSILAASSTFGKNVLPRIAALCDVVQISDVIRVIDSDTFEHPIYAGNAIETVRILDQKKVLCIRTTAFDALDETQAPCEIKPIEPVCSDLKTTFLSQALSPSVRPQLSDASIVVSGGRGLQSAEQFQLIEALADVLGAAVGASRAAVDAGFVSNDCQVGQTGKVVAPTLYIAVGISGAIQHLAGMKDAKVIVAINKDEDAPIFQIANYGLVGDLFQLVPQLIEQLKSLSHQ